MIILSAGRASPRPWSAALSAGDAGRLAGLLGLLADPVRSRILFALVGAGELCVGDLALALDVTEDQVSYALKMLRMAGLVSFRKDGRVVYYRLARRLPASPARALPAPAADHRRTGGRRCASLDAIGARAGHCRVDDLADPLGADPGLHAVRGHPGPGTPETMSRLLGDDRPRTLARATGLGAASSSCSYAAVALARSLFRKGASFTAAMVFEIATTNLVIELGIILAC